MDKGIIQPIRDRNALRSREHQSRIKATLKGKAGYDEFCDECGAANPAKAAQSSKIRCTKEEMGEKFPLVNHGLVELHPFTLFFLTCIGVAGPGVTREELMKCTDVTESMQELPAEMGGSEPFVQSAVAADLVQFEQHPFAKLPVLLRVKETPFSDIFTFNQRDFLIVSSQTY